MPREIVYRGAPARRPVSASPIVTLVAVTQLVDMSEVSSDFTVQLIRQRTADALTPLKYLPRLAFSFPLSSAARR